MKIALFFLFLAPAISFASTPSLDYYCCQRKDYSSPNCAVNKLTDESCRKVIEDTERQAREFVEARKKDREAELTKKNNIQAPSTDKSNGQ
jgi:hypothetical protein